MPIGLAYGSRTLAAIPAQLPYQDSTVPKEVKVARPATGGKLPTMRLNAKLPISPYLASFKQRHP